MNEEIYSIALMNALSEIKNAYTAITWSFLITRNGTVILSEENAANPNIAKSARSLQSLVEKAGAVGGLESMLINGEKGKVHVSWVKDMCLVAGLAKNADLVYFRNITGTVFSTILKVFEGITSNPPVSDLSMSPSEARFSSTQAPTELAASQPAIEETPIAAELEEAEDSGKPMTPELGEPEELEVNQQLGSPSSQQLIVDRLDGLMVKSDTVQIDSDVLKQWSALLKQKEISEVEIETFGGETARFKAKAISNSKLENRGLIRIPEKALQELELKRGELVRVKPVKSEKAEKTKKYDVPGYTTHDAHQLEAASFRM